MGKVITLIGISGIGKSYWSQRFAEELGYTHLSADARIAAELRAELDLVNEQGLNEQGLNEQGLNEQGLNEQRLATWLGFPTSPQYEENEQRYLKLDRRAIENFAAVAISQRDNSQISYIIDTSGSSIYVGEPALNRLAELGPVVYLEIEAGQEALLVERFLASPKPIVWNKTFLGTPDSIPSLDILRQSYQRLLASRKELYEQYSTIRIAYQTIHSFSSAADFERYIDLCSV